MNRSTAFFLVLGWSLAAAPLLPAQDAAAPIRRSSPVEPVPTPLGKGEETATPVPTPSPTLAPEQTPETPKPTPTAVQSTPARVEPGSPDGTPFREPLVLPTEPPRAPTPTATPRQTPVPTPKATPAPTARPAPKPRATPIVSPTPPASESAVEENDKTPAARRSSRSILQEKPVRAIERRSPSASRRSAVEDQSDNVGASRPTFDLSKRGHGNVSATVRGLENQWQAAIRNHDVSALSSLLAADFVGTSSTGRVGSKETMLSELRKDKNEYKSVEARSMSVRTQGGDIAVVTGVTKETGTTRDGERFSTSLRFTDTWVKRNGEWRCIASQTTELPKG